MIGSITKRPAKRNETKELPKVKYSNRLSHQHIKQLNYFRFMIIFYFSVLSWTHRRICCFFSIPKSSFSCYFTRMLNEINFLSSHNCKYALKMMMMMIWMSKRVNEWVSDWASKLRSICSFHLIHHIIRIKSAKIISQ